jgi:1,4-dihydroxy-2-naphthoate octaprenyltransferase
MAGFLAAYVHAFSWAIFFLCVLTTISLQILSNLANDYGDSIHGADSIERKGPSRAVQSGVISKQSMKRAIAVFVLLCLASGISLLLLAFGLNWRAISFFLCLGLVCIVAAMAYTMGKRPYGYAGLGDLSVFIFFGFVGVMGSYYLFTQAFSWSLIFPAISCGVFSIAVLNINNIRDIDSDLKAGKHSVPVRIGRKNAIVYHWSLLICGVLTAFAYTMVTYHSAWQLLFVLAIPLLLKNAMAVKTRPSVQLDPYLKQMAITTLLFVLLFGTGLML